MSAADTQMQPLDLSCPRTAAGQPSSTPPPSAASASAVAVVEPAEPPRLPTPTTAAAAAAAEEAAAVPLNLTSSSPPSDGDTPTTSGPARKRFLTKYLHKDRGERVSERVGREEF